MKIKYFAMALTVSLTTFGSSFSALADTKGIVTADALNIRSAPTTDSAILGQLPYGSNITITNKLDNWYIINYNDSNAYICADYIKESAESDISESLTLYSEQTNIAPISGDVPSYEGSEIPGEMLVEIAKQYVGTPYVYGGMSPSGFDCSGFVKYCYSKLNVDINRIACDQALNGYEVAKSDMKPGDILCFASSVGGSYIGHTGIYVGNDYFIHSPRTGFSVEIIPLNTGSFSQRLINIRRILN